MKNKIILLSCSVFISFTAFSQDTTHTLQYHTDSLFKNTASHNKISFRNKPDTRKNNKKPMYRDTRLGSSSKMYNTYKKNDYGAGAITTDPTK